ncbi:NAD-binding protein [Prescottella equi]|uniref:Prephenate dehydrogenase n=1 Tax=Prescottella equi ATCC 33707 TaxID=525370 RepID=E9T623_RHOHA|nr:NAD-binding protein [Prescottella equi]EGD22010.1 putative prephenate dehydrogenase [Prescottella equi ATCC 33707]
MTTPPDTTTCALVIVGGAGAVGAMLAESARAEGDSVTVVDPAAAPVPGVDGVCGDVTDPDPQVRALLAEADAVILAVPEAVAVAAVPVVDGAMKPGAVLVETLSVKSEIHRVLRDRASTRPAVGINPLFAPGLGMAGRPVAAVIHHDSPAVERFLGAVTGWGARVVAMSADEHDRTAAATQALTHAAILAFGLALGDLGIDADTLVDAATPPHTTLLALLGRVATGQAEVYHDIQAGNPQAAAARAALAAALRRLSEAVEHGGPREFGDVMAAARAPLGDHLDRYRALCADLFTGPLAPERRSGGGTP